MNLYLIGSIPTDPFQTRVYIEASSDTIAKKIRDSISDEILPYKEFCIVAKEDEQIIKNSNYDIDIEAEINSKIILHENLPIIKDIPRFKHLSMCNAIIIAYGIKYIGSVNSGIIPPKGIYHQAYKSYSGSTIIMIDPFQKIYYDIDMS